MDEIQLNHFPKVSVPEQPVLKYFLQESDFQLVPQPAGVVHSHNPPFPIHSISENDITRSINPWLITERTESPFADILLLPTPQIDQTAIPDPHNQSQFRTLGNKGVICTHNACGARFSRRTDLRRHHDNIHIRAKPFLCSFTGCPRAKNGFSRKDKRHDHERKIHGTM